MSDAHNRVTDALIDWYDEAIEMQDLYDRSDMQARAEIVARQIIAMLLDH